MLAAPNRLKKPRDITRAYKAGVYGGARGEMSLRAAANRRPESRIVVVVAKKVSKKAVVRNTIRRRLVGLLRQIWETVPAGYDIVISVHSDMSHRPAAGLRELLDQSLRSAGLLE